MGSLLSIFRSKRDTKAILEEIQNEIESIEDFKDIASKREKNCICLLFTSFVVLYIISFVIYYCFYFNPNNIKDNVIRLLPLIVLPFIFYCIKQSFRWYYRYIGDNKDEKLKQLKKQKKKILEKVKETENFKDAKEILEKYDPKALFESYSFRTLNACSTPVVNNTPNRLAQTDSQLRYRTNISPMRPMPAIMASPFGTQPNASFRPNPMSMGSTATRAPFMTPQRLPVLPMAPPIRTIKPILPQNRSVVDKLVDYVVGDGPNSRYALICIHCYSHNGMALKEEFEFISFICCYCKRFNPSRKTRPMAPRLQPLEQSQRSSLAPVVDEPESDSDSERGRIGPHIQEITSNTENDTQNEKHIENNKENENKSENENISKDLTEESNDIERVDPISEVITNTDNTSNDSEDKLHVIEDNDEKEIAFIDDSDL